MADRGRGGGRGSGGAGGGRRGVGHQPDRGRGGRPPAENRGSYPRDNQAQHSRPQRGQQRSDASQYQSGTGHGYNGRGTSFGRGNRRGGGYGSRTSQIRYSRERLSLDSPHGDGPWGFKHSILPDNVAGFKALIPKDISPGKLFEKKVHIQTNFFLTKIKLPKELCRYEIGITKEVPEGGRRNKRPLREPAAAPGDPPQQPRPLNKDLRVKIFKWLVPRIQAAWAAGNQNVRLGLIHDFSQIMITTKKLENQVPLMYLIPHQELDDEDDSNVNYRVTIARAVLILGIPRLQGVLNDLINFTDENDTEMESIEQIYNILLKNIGGEHYIHSGRNSLMRIPENDKDTNIGGGLCNWQGISAVFPMRSSWKPYINIDAQNSAFRIGQPVNDAIKDVLQDSRNRRLRLNDVTTWQDSDFDAVLDLLRSCKVTREVDGRRLDGVIRGLVRQPPSAVSFRCEELNDQVVTIPEYFRKRYNMNINQRGLLLQIGPIAQVPAELCSIKRGQSYDKIITNENVTRNMLEKATERPEEKQGNIQTAINDLQLTQSALLDDFGVRFNDQFLDIKNARVLKPPELCYGVQAGDHHEQDEAAALPNRGRLVPLNGVWDQWRERVEFFDPMNIDNWAVLILDDPRSDPTSFIRELRQNGNNIGGMAIPEPSNTVLAGNIQERGDPEENIQRIAAIFTEMKENWQEGSKIVFVVIPRKGCNLYNQVKQAAELPANAGILTQCVIKRNLEMANHAVVKNILLKVNAKLGGTNHVPVIPECLGDIDILKNPTMIVGIDVNHPSGGHGPIPQPSFAAVTASISRSGMPYMMNVRAQLRVERGAAEVVQNLEDIIFDMINEFCADDNENKVKGIKPSKIIVYRDGVGAGQFPEILHVEMRAIRSACARFDEVNNPYEPKITIIVVQKRHDVRFFLKTADGRTENAPAGTVVDTEIVKGGFYLLSHTGILGTSRPAHYQILWDDSDFTMDQIQALTNYLCYMYSRCNRAVSYPAPTYYAHWAAKRANVLCRTGGRLPEWWNGTVQSLQQMNEALRRNEEITAEYPMHFI